MSSIVRPAVGDCGLAGRDGQRQRWHHQPRPISDIRFGERHLVSNFSGVSIGRTNLSERSGVEIDLRRSATPRILRLRRGGRAAARHLRDARRRPRLLTEFKLLRVAVDDVGGQSGPAGPRRSPPARPRRGRVSPASLKRMVDGEPGQRGAARDRPHTQVVRAAVSAHRSWDG